MTPLSPKKRSELRARAHKLSPTVLIGDKGLTDEVVAEVDRSLKAHELIKVRASSAEREARDVWLETLCERLQAHPVQQIGKVFVIYRENPKEAKPEGTDAAPPRRRRAGNGAGSARARQQKAFGRGEQRKSGGRGELRKTGGGGEERKALGRGGVTKRRPRGDAAASEVKRTSRPRSRTPSPRPASEPRRRRPRTSR